MSPEGGKVDAPTGGKAAKAAAPSAAAAASAPQHVGAEQSAAVPLLPELDALAAKRQRALKKKLNKITTYEAMLAAGQTLNEEQVAVVEQKDAVEGKVRRVTARRVSRGKGRSARWPALLARRRARADCAAGAAVRRRGPS